MVNPENQIKKVSVNRDLCIGAASCVVASASVFELDSENKAILKLKGGVKNSGPADKENFEDSAISDELLMQAAQSCPTKAIFLYDSTGKQLYP